MFYADAVWWAAKHGPVSAAELARLTRANNDQIQSATKALALNGLLRTNKKGKICATHQTMHLYERIT